MSDERDLLSRKIAELTAQLDEKTAQNTALQQQVTTLQTKNSSLQTQNLSLREQLNLLFHKRFGSSSEKLTAQMRLFDEAEQDSIEEDGEKDDSQLTDETTVKPHTRKKPGRKPLPEFLPRIEIIHDIPESQKLCPHDGTALKVIGEETSEQLDIIPAKVQVLRHVRLKYGCPCCETGVKTAALPKQPIPKSMASPGLLAHIATAKYVDALPLYRMENILQRFDIDIPRATMANWMIKLSELITPLMNLLRERMLGLDYLQMDETTVQVLNEKGKEAQSKSYMWVQRGGPPDKPIILFDYAPTRGSSVPVSLLDGFAGTLQTDGYEGYNAVVKSNQLRQAGCWAHARRKFDEAVKSQGKKGKAKASRARAGLSFIQKLYRIEQSTKDMTSDERTDYRQQHALPLLGEIRQWLDNSLPLVPPTSMTGKALNYLHGQWQKLILYTGDGRIHIDNNLAENAIRPFTLGRKNWLFSQSVKGARASASLYSLIETAKANQLEPYHYLKHVFKELPRASSLEAIESLLPFNLTMEKLK